MSRRSLVASTSTTGPGRTSGRLTGRCGAARRSACPQRSSRQAVRALGPGPRTRRTSMASTSRSRLLAASRAASRLSRMGDWDATPTLSRPRGPTERALRGFRYPSSLAAPRTRSAVAGDTRPRALPESTSDPVAEDTPARAATSLIVGAIRASLSAGARGASGRAGVGLEGEARPTTARVSAPSPGLGASPAWIPQATDQVPDLLMDERRGGYGASPTISSIGAS